MFKDLLLLILKFFNKDNDNSEENNENVNLNNKVNIKKEEKKKQQEENEKAKTELEKRLNKIKKEEKKRIKEEKKLRKEKTKSFLFKKRKKEKDFAYITITFAISFVILIVYLISTVLTFTFSKEEMFIAIIDKKQEPYKLRYSVLTMDYQKGNEVGDIMELNYNGNSCFNKDETCFNFVIKKIKNNKVYLDFNDFEMQTEISKEDFEAFFNDFSAKDRNYIKDYKVFGKIVNDKFVITKIEFNSEK